MASISHAGTMGSISKFALEEKPDLLLYGGVYGIQQGVQQHIYISGLIGNEYVPTQRSDGNALVGVGVFKDLFTKGKTTTQAGVQLYYLAQSHVAGQVLLENAFNDVNYQYGMSYLPLYLNLKANVKSNKDWLSFVFDAGVGPDFITMNQYHETALSSGTIPDLAYNGQSDTSVSVTLGAGARLSKLPKNGWLEVGYRFFYLGDAKFSPSNALYLTDLDAGSMFANAFVMSIHV